MLSRRLYYRFKPYLPWAVRMKMRQTLAGMQRRWHRATWPINPTAGEPPVGWPGWPEGKKFALVFTHDVEGQDGLSKVQQLVELEQQLGFRSSFNFIPQSEEYQVSDALRAQLCAAGFEVGVHDLRHDGRLYWGRDGFAEKAQSINRYIKEWGAAGFRAGFMLRKLECLNDLDIAYDATTFDTDPFEPQPEGVNTIFPFWIARPQGGGYVELPYTLAQDSTLYLVLREKNNEIWKRKLDWIAARGGMALLNVHPDYTGFDPKQRKPSEYDVAHYRNFLEYVKQQYSGQYWNVLPRDLAQWYKGHYQLPLTGPAAEKFAVTTHTRPLAGKRAGVVVFSYYASDPRPRRETEALAQAGMEVDVICLRQDAKEPLREVLNGVKIRRVPMKRRRAGKLTYVLQYVSFLLSAFFLLTWWRLRRRYDLVHVHNMPDFLVFSALVPRLTGARVILDLHDPMPELLVTIFGLKEESKGVRLLKFMEKWSMAFADHVITVNRACEKIFLRRSCPPGKIQVLMNVPDERVYRFRGVDEYPPRDPAKPFVIMYHGSIVERNGLDVAVAAVKELRQTVPTAQLWVYGPVTPFLESVMASVKQDGLTEHVRHLGQKSQAEIVKAIYECDIGVIPNRNNAFTEINTPTRIFEYLSLGKPVIAPRSTGITDYFGPEDIIYFDLGSATDLAARLKQAYDAPDWVRAVAKRGQAIYQQQCWSRVRHDYIGRVMDLIKRA